MTYAEIRATIIRCLTEAGFPVTDEDIDDIIFEYIDNDDYDDPKMIFEYRNCDIIIDYCERTLEAKAEKFEDLPKLDLKPARGKFKLTHDLSYKSLYGKEEPEYNKD